VTVPYQLCKLLDSRLVNGDLAWYFALNPAITLGEENASMRGRDRTPGFQRRFVLLSSVRWPCLYEDEVPVHVMIQLFVVACPF